MTSKTCANPWCNNIFKITEQDKNFYKKIAPVFNGKSEPVPEHIHCRFCREQQRMAFRNEWNFYRRKCDLTGENILSIYSEEKPYTVYEQSLWWSDRFDPLEYGRDFDFNRPFFEQWQDLSLVTPRASIHNANSENCEYTNYSGENKNSYLVVGTLFCEDSFYSYRASKCKDIFDCHDPVECQLCYETRFCKKLYECTHCSHCYGSHNLTLCDHCSECSDCFGCVNLKHKKYHIFNEPFSEENYRKKVQELKQNFQEAQTLFQKFKQTQPHRAVDTLNCHNSTGDNLINCKDCQEVFVFKDAEESSYCSFCEGNNSCMDSNFSNIGELQYHSTNLVKNYHVMFGNFVWYNNHSIYGTSCFNSSNIFGCVGTKKHEYCILNKQYSKEEYENLVPKIIAHMRETGEWGQYYPVKYSPFAFNETAGQTNHPITRQEALNRGWKWKDSETSGSSNIPQNNVPTDIQKVPDSICDQVLYCQKSGKPYKIQKAELQFYRKMNLPIPQYCPNQRYEDRIALNNPHKLWTRECSESGKEIQTTYAPDRPEKIVSEEYYTKQLIN